jgi:small conductance mechanosensitive channel
MAVFEEVQGFVNSFFTGYILNIVIALTIILIGFVFGRMIGKMTTNLLHEIELNMLFKKATNNKFDIEGRSGSFLKYLIYFFVILTALNQLGVTSYLLYIIAIAIVLFIIISLTLGIRDLIPNMFASFTLHRRGFVAVGDSIKVKDIKGKILSIDLIETKVETKQGDIIAVPNVVLVRNEVTKFSR